MHGQAAWEQKELEVGGSRGRQLKGSLLQDADGGSVRAAALSAGRDPLPALFPALPACTPAFPRSAHSGAAAQACLPPSNFK